MTLTRLRAASAARRRLTSGAGGGDTPVGTTTLINDQFNRSGSITTSTNSTDPVWYVGVGSGPFNLNGSTLTRVGNTGFDRNHSQFRFGGPGKQVRYRYRARVTTFQPKGGWGGAAGLKFGMKFPSNFADYPKDDPRSVALDPQSGQYTSGQSASYVAVDGITDIGHYEIATLGYDTANYLGFYNAGAPNIPNYVPGTWVEKTIEMAWIGSDVRFRFWDNAAASGTPVWTFTHTNSPMQDKGYLWWRLDYVDIEMDYFIVEESAV